MLHIVSKWFLKCTYVHETVKPDYSRDLNLLSTFPRLQSDSDCRVNFKYHEIIKFFRKRVPPGIEPAIPRMAGRSSTVRLAHNLLWKSKNCSILK